MKPYKVVNNYVFIVYEFPNKNNKAGHIHGVYVNKSEAIGKHLKLMEQGKKESVVLKKSILGKNRGYRVLPSALNKKRFYICVEE